MIHLQNITKAYSKNMVALKNVTIKIESGEFVSLVGMSGAGKTTLVKILIASEKADDGRVVVGGWDITDIRNKDVPYLRRQIGVVFQDYKLLDKKTIFESVKKTSKVIVLHEQTKTGGVGAEVSSLITEYCFDYLDGPIIRIAAQDTPVPYSAQMEEAFIPQVKDVLSAVEKLIRY